MKTVFGKRGLARLLAGLGMTATLAVPTLNSPWALAATEVVPLERLHIHDVILLPTVRSQYEAKFTKPTTWQVEPSTALYLEFQHAIQLQPHRSWLQIILNDKVIKHIPLTRENTEGTKMTIPLPVGLLQDFNKLNFRVEQHYTDKCEDPLDKSLWTQILPATKIIFNYNPVVPKVDLNAYPYPIVDSLTYSPAKVHYITSRDASSQELQALAYINTHLAQQAQDHELNSRITFDNSAGPDNEHVVFVGKGSEIGQVTRYQTAFGDYSLQGGQWMNHKTGHPLGNDQGLILFFQAPGSKEHTVLVVTGNSDEAVLKAAEYLTLRPKDETLSGLAKEVPSGWNPPGVRSAKVPRFVENQTRTFRELGFNIEEVHKINAPPITYHVPVVSQFRNTSGKMWLDVTYSYSPELNPEFSSLELRMNDVSIANIPLTNPQGEQMKQASIPISPELIQARNTLVAQFHLMPDKYGWCVDNYVDNAWGKILDDSQFRVEGSPTSRLPDVGLLNSTMYPYSQNDNLEGVHIVLPSNPTAETLDAMLGFTTRLGRVTLADTDLRLNVSKGGSIPTNQHVAVFRPASESLQLPDGARLIWQLNGATKRLTLADPAGGNLMGQLAELGQGAYVEQYLMGGNQAISVFTAADGKGFLSLGQLFEADKQFETLTSGFLQQASLLNPQQVNNITEIAYHQEAKDKGASGNWWENILNWLKSLPWMQVIIGMVAVFAVLLILPILVRALFRRR